MPPTRKNHGKTVIKGGVRAGRDVVIGDQHNYYYETKINSQEDFVLAISFLRSQLSELLNQKDINLPLKKNIQEIGEKLKEVDEESKTAKPKGESIHKILVEAKEYLDVVSGSIQSATVLGTLMGNLAAAAIRLFGN